jgi:hypothetical protein
MVDALLQQTNLWEVCAIPHHGVPALPVVCAVVPEHRAVLRKASAFIGRMLRQDDVDLTYFVTAHELGHQWWAHQLIGAQVQGSNMMSETLAQYSASMVIQQKYGKDYMHKVMRQFLDRYLRGRAGELRHEPRLALYSGSLACGTKRAAKSCTRWPNIFGRTRSKRPFTIS